MTPMQRSLGFLRSQGYRAFITEHYNYYARKRFDFAGFADILAFKRTETGITAIQTTTGSNAAARIEKIQGNENVVEFLASGNRVVVHSWDKRGDRNKRKLWTLVEREIGINQNGQIFERERTQDIDSNNVEI